MIKCDDGKVKIEGEPYQIMSELAWLQRKIFEDEFLTREQIDQAHKLAFMNKQEMIEELLKELSKKMEELFNEDKDD